MKSRLLASCVLLVSCGGGDGEAVKQDSTITYTQCASDFNLTILSEQKTTSYIALWSDQRMVNASDYTLCSNTTLQDVTEQTSLIGCNPLKSGAFLDEKTHFRLGEEVSLTHLFKNQLFLQFENAQGKYLCHVPLTFDKALIDSSIQYLKAPNSNVNDRFGHSVAISKNGKTLAVGAPYVDYSETLTDAGAVYLFHDDGNGWQENPTIITHPFPDANDLFGFRLDMSEDGKRLAIAAPQDDAAFNGSSAGADPANNSVNNLGGIFIYDKDDNSLDWQLAGLFKGQQLGANDNFQYGFHHVELSPNGNHLAFGSLIETNSLQVYFYANDQWQRLNPINVNESTGYGIAFNQDGTTLAVGVGKYEPDDIDDVYFDSGGVYIYRRGVESQNFFHSATIVPEQQIKKNQFGESVALSAEGTILALGSMSGNLVYIYDFDGGNWTKRYQLSLPYHTNEDNFGEVLSLSQDGTRLAVANYKDDTYASGIFQDGNISERATNSGAVYLFHLASNDFSYQAFFKSPYFRRDDYMGSALSISADGRSLVAGSPYDDTNANSINPSQVEYDASNSGAAIIYAF